MAPILLLTTKALAQETEMPPEVIIEQILADGEELPVAELIELPAGKRNLTILYIPADDAPLGTYSYRFRMQGLDTSWIYGHGRRSIIYRNIPPSTYRFQIQASRDGSLWGAITRLELDIPHRYYETFWFWIVTALTLLFAGAIFLQWLIKAERRRSVQLQALVDDRTSELKETNDRLEDALQRVRYEHRIASEALGRIEEQKKELLKMDQLKSHFFSNISHEFRTPLTLITEPVNAALDGLYGKLNREVQKMLVSVRDHSDRLLLLINQLLDLAKLEMGSMNLHARKEDVVSFVRTLTHAFISEAERNGLKLIFKSDVERLEVFFDAEKLSKILYNLLSNSMKATETGGKIHVSLHQRMTDKRVEIKIRDTGRGIPPEHIPHLFNRFYQVEESDTSYRTGTGLGLALVKELTELHHGSIHVESSLGFGSTFTLLLPLGNDHLQAHEIEEQISDALPSSSLRNARAYTAGAKIPEEELTESSVNKFDQKPLVQVVEDDPEVRALIVQRLKKTYQINQANTGVEAMEMIRLNRPEAIVSDVRMPDMDGLTFCRLLKSDPGLNDIPIVLLTARADNESRIEGLQIGADAYLTKPFNTKELLAILENLIHSRRSMRNQYSDELILKPNKVSVSSADAIFLQRLNDIVETHLSDETFSVQTLSEKLSVSQSNLKRKLRSTVNLTPVEFIRLRRLERAAKLLEQKAGTVSEISYQVGFQNLSYFTKCFREHFGVQPSRYQVSLDSSPEKQGPKNE